MSNVFKRCSYALDRPISSTRRLTVKENDRGRLEALNQALTCVHKADVKKLPRLQHGIDKALFVPGILSLVKGNKGLSKYVQTIHRLEKFNYDLLAPYYEPSEHKELNNLARKFHVTFTGSTSTLSKPLSQLHFFISQWKKPSTGFLGDPFNDPATTTFTRLTRLPCSFTLKRNGSVYSVNKDIFDDDSGNKILMSLGKSLETFLTVDKQEFSRFFYDNPTGLQPSQPVNLYNYSKFGSILMRSQLDCYDHRVSRSGIFDLKTRAVFGVRMDREHPELYSKFKILGRSGIYSSFEREQYDMIRSSLLKYSIQARIGNMAGVFITYHNTRVIFGFQFLALDAMDKVLYGSSTVGNQCFSLTVQLYENILKRSVATYPKANLRITFYTTNNTEPKLFVFVENLDSIIPAKSACSSKSADSSTRSRTEDSDKTTKRQHIHPTSCYVYSLRHNLNGQWVKSLPQSMLTTKNWFVDYVCESMTDESHMLSILDRLNRTTRKFAEKSAKPSASLQLLLQQLASNPALYKDFKVMKPQTLY
ncbi:RNA metabolism pathway protein Pet127 [Schizosaccharomyces japonicus yFS275]|uniref:RNA metabolism pathway protein Pet127 n=1 Tax=Schizosaccharomyces japonicus (strain yFS275 / FY16936) TaxID=402676 RepID=B6K2R0_SCHJY|nr:RNA metabolism pathway protein Pet127 [Schizosaccharomyces japonicus yFS275]EEB07441.1 RNA metabolism pathway protein Pet127 [Schizosaccharomyces japonicus yFS275]